MDVTAEVAALRDWLKEDETRLQGPPVGHGGNGMSAPDHRINNFQQFGDKQWGNGPSGWPWTQWNQFNNS
jgi:hypothetical protein